MLVGEDLALAVRLQALDRAGASVVARLDLAVDGKRDITLDDDLFSRFVLSDGSGTSAALADISQYPPTLFFEPRAGQPSQAIVELRYLFRMEPGEVHLSVLDAADASWRHRFVAAVLTYSLDVRRGNYGELLPVYVSSETREPFNLSAARTGPHLRSNLGDTVRLRLRNLDPTLPHELWIDGLGIGVGPVPPGGIAETTFVAATPGRFRYRDRRDPGHGFLSGQLTVVASIDQVGDFLVELDESMLEFDRAGQEARVLVTIRSHRSFSAPVTLLEPLDWWEGTPPRQAWTQRFEPPVVVPPPNGIAQVTFVLRIDVYPSDGWTCGQSTGWRGELEAEAFRGLFRHGAPLEIRILPPAAASEGCD